MRSDGTPLIGCGVPPDACRLRGSVRAGKMVAPREGRMNIDSEIRSFSDLSSIDKARFLARFMYELTLDGRNFYSPNSTQDIDANKLRFINELQHRVTRFIEQILIDDPARSPDDVMLRLLLAPRAEKTIEALVRTAYARTIQAVG
jgi:hypothetical protein